MAYHIKKASAIDPNVTVYYAGGNRWSDDYSQRTSFATEGAANAKLVNTDGKNGGWTGATVVSE
tara:strand:+ start:292 stop:483 length:192 start_codon:yes stop_codon:yes gene_type:complete